MTADRRYIEQLRKAAAECGAWERLGTPGIRAKLKAERRWQALMLGLSPDLLIAFCDLWLAANKERDHDQETTTIQDALPPESGA